MPVENNAGSGARLLCCTAIYFVRQVFANPWSSLGLPSPLWIQKQSNYRHLHTMFTAACDPPEKLILVLVLCSNVLRMILNLAYNEYDELNSVHQCPVGFHSKLCKNSGLGDFRVQQQ